MARYVLFRRGAHKPSEDVTRVVEAEGGSVLDRTGERAYLVDVEREVVERLRSLLSGWSVEPEADIDPP